MKPVSIDRLRTEGQAFMEEISREYYLAGAGLKPTADLQPIYDRHKEIIGPDAVTFVRESLHAAPPKSESARQARMLLEWLSDLQASRQLAALEEREFAWEASAVVRVDGKEVEFQQSSITLANTADRRERLQLERARNKLIENELSPMRRERFSREREIIEQLGIAPSYNATFEAVSGIPLRDLRDQCEDFLEQTAALWDDTFPRFVRKVLNIDPRDATRGDAARLFRGHRFDEHFPASSMEWEIRRQVREMGIDPIAGGRVLFDTEARPGKRSRAFCAPVRVPDEVYLVIRPHGGQLDWWAFLHELGHALHFGYMAADLPFEYRWLGDNSVTESFAMLFDHLIHDPGWLARYTPLAASVRDEFTRTMAF
ncbi:MAG TPA: hypothetical protein VIV65_03495, partial [Gemmatimonadaceae bacterium]